MKKEEVIIGSWADMSNGIIVPITIKNMNNFMACDNIEITRSMLLKSGFENKYGNIYFFKKLKFSYENNKLSRFVQFHYSGKVASIKYVHQLQNLIQILTGEQIDILI